MLDGQEEWRRCAGTCATCKRLGGGDGGWWLTVDLVCGSGRNGLGSVGQDRTPLRTGVGHDAFAHRFVHRMRILSRDDTAQSRDALMLYAD